MIYYQSIPYNCDLFIKKLGQLNWSQILQSALGSGDQYSIYTADPVATLQTFGQETIIKHQGQSQKSNDDPFSLCHQWRIELLGEESQCDLPFCGGIIGLFGYDLGRRFENIPNLEKTHLECPDMSVGIYDWALIEDQFTQQTWLVVNHPDAPTYWKSRYNWLQGQTESKLGTFQLVSQWKTNLNFENYQQCFNQIHAFLKSGDCYQINLTQQFSSSFQGDPRSAYLQLLQANGTPYSAYLKFPQSTVISISPERFIALKEQQIETKPIKGTRPRGKTPQEDQWLANELQASTKDKAENVMIVDLLRSDIGRVSQPGTVRVPQLFAIESFNAVHHLVSTVTGTLYDHLSAEDLLRACFPGGSITGAPKVRAMEIIETIEPHRRNAYCGAIGYISQNKRMDTNITIRTLVTEQQNIYAWAGGGIVADSKVDEEYQECLDKLGRILPLLQEV
ncbi:MAG: Aminodeoxychorismate synthase component 1 [Candidatus Celerinatantimonas neptuna]|nr:MAG: Aminodeoxychorismate synthase component 1 [Candidatus Celerinatantimonas neptuna]